MLPVMEDVLSPIDFSSEELTWLKASELLDVPLTPPPKSTDIFMRDISLSSSTDSQSSSSSASTSRRYTTTSSKTSATAGNPSRKGFDTTATPRKAAGQQQTDSPRSEWIYRRPKTPASPRQPRSANSNTPPRPRPQTGYHPSSRNYHSPTISSLSRTTQLTVHKTPSTWSEPSTSLPSTPALTSASTAPFWSAMLKPRSRSERSMPLLKSIPSESQISLIRPDVPTSSSSTPSTPQRRSISSPRLMSARPPSVSSTLSSVSSSPSPSSSRSESPVTPVSMPPSPFGTPAAVRRRSTPYHHRRHRTTPPPCDRDLDAVRISSSCPPPSKSILTRTPSVSTKDSTHTINKCVKFAAVPIVHYASRGYWDVELREVDDDDEERYSGCVGDTMGINVDGMDIDEDPFGNYQAHYYSREREDVRRLDLARLREIREHQSTPTPEREREKARGLKRLMSLSRKPEPTTGTSTSVATAVKPTSTFSSSTPPSSFSPSAKAISSSTSAAATTRPTISTPYALGLYPTQLHPTQSTASLRAAGQRSKSPLRGYSSTNNNNNNHNITVNNVGVGPSSSDLHLPEKAGLRTAPSMESFRSSKSGAARSVRSLGSVRSTSSISGLKAWFGRTMGWSEV